ncbi:MAG: hypothetical protein VXW65_11770 [Pseudomonadota bacterium]|nr:hypothetical protein [Pseudomonadota bacterium]
MKRPDKKKIERQSLIDAKTRKSNIRDKNKGEAFHGLRIGEFVSVAADPYRNDLLKIIDYMKKCHKKKSICYLDFYKTKTLFPNGTIYLYSHLRKMQSLKILGRPSEDIIVRAMLTKLGISSRLNMPCCRKNHSRVERWHILHGSKTNFHEEYIEIENSIKKAVGSENSELFFVLNEAISEAVTNVVNHAYDQNSVYKDWVLFLSFDGDKFHLVISDLGKSIPVTAPVKLRTKIAHLLTSLQKPSDSDLIEIATTWRRSATHQPYRGKGFDNIIEVCREEPEASLSVMSRAGSWRTGKNTSSDGKKHSFAKPISGTIVSWTIPLKKLKMDEQLSSRVEEPAT